MLDVVLMVNESHTSKSSVGMHVHADDFSISGIKMDKATRTTQLTAKPASWKQVAGAFDMDFGKGSLTTQSQNRLRRRDFLGFLGDALDGVKQGFDALTGGEGN